MPESSAIAAKHRPSYIMIGGFLGAGKTTAISGLARILAGQGQRVGLITNDQGHRLVDTATLSARGFPVEEIPGGCFCCRFNSLMEATRKLTAATKPDLFLAEPVGSCTDLVATVSYPLRRLYGDDFTIAPLSVLIDPIRTQRMLGLTDGGNFSPKVRYIYKKQLEEADRIVINKCDLLTAAQLAALRTALQDNFPNARLWEISARNQIGLDDWLADLLSGEPGNRPPMTVDYDLYAEGEALLGWLNATVRLAAPEPVDGNALLQGLAEDIRRRLAQEEIEIAHLKMTLDPVDGLGDLAVVNLVRNDFVPELSQQLPGTIEQGELILNLRAEGPPPQLRQAVEQALAETPGPLSAANVVARLEHLEVFQPGRPQPTHRESTA